MKKKFAAMLVLSMMVMGSLSACGKNEISGRVDEIKDFMFVIEASDGAYYSFPVNEETKSDLSEIEIGDEVTVSYEGTLSEVDAFSGEVFSVEKK